MSLTLKRTHDTQAIVNIYVYVSYWRKKGIELEERAEKKERIPFPRFTPVLFSGYFCAGN